MKTELVKEEEKTHNRSNQWKKKKKEEEETQEKKEPNSQPREERKKENQKLRLVLFMGPLCVFNYNIAIELWVMETENSQICFQFP